MFFAPDKREASGGKGTFPPTHGMWYRETAKPRVRERISAQHAAGLDGRSPLIDLERS